MVNVVERGPFYSIAQSINLIIRVIFGLIFFFILLRFLFRLLGANPLNNFVSWLYRFTQPLISPFVGIFPAPDIPGRAFLEPASLIALLVYTFIAYLLTLLVSYLANLSREV